MRQTQFHKYLLLALAMVIMALAGCADDFGDSAGDSADMPKDCITLRVSVPMAANTRAADDDFNEFKVESLHLYFFSGEDNDDSGEYLFDYVLNENFSFSRTLMIPMPGDAFLPGGLFGTAANECVVYAVANVDEERLTGKTIDSLKKTVVDSNFANTVVQDKFAMDCRAVLSLDRDNRVAAGDIILQRAAAKLSLAVDLPQSITVTETITNPLTGITSEVEQTYASRPDDMRVWMSNGVFRSELFTEPKSAEADCIYSNDMDSRSGSTFVHDASQPKYKYTQEVPFYSYPNTWDPYSPTGNSYLTLLVPWTYTDAEGRQVTKNTYYKLAVQQGRNTIARNMHYDMRVTVGRLGGTSVEKPVDMMLDWNYAILWNTQTLPTDIKEVSYLLLNNNDFDASLDAYYFQMDNETEISVPFHSSHPVAIESVSLKWHDFKNNADREITLKSSGNASGTYRYDTLSGYDSHKSSYFVGIEIDQLNSTLKLKREMYHILYSNGRASINTDETAINAFTFTIKLRHDTNDYSPSNPAQNATVVIRQIPAIYITSQYTKKGYRFINNNNTTYGNNSNSYRGYVTTNSASVSGTKAQYYLGSIHENTSYNWNTYIINITKFSNDDNYVISDPRSRSVDNLSVNNTGNANEANWSVEDNNKKRLQHYYPAEKSDQKSRFIAPQIRVASQWGVTYDITREAAERRCASYQENGRPAGRWRVPTYAEIEFISKLSNKGLIPYLFGDADNSGNNYADYWCATGAIAVDNSATNPRVFIPTDNATKRSVRCVYDDWFWGNDTIIEANKNKFIWGDRERSTIGNQ